ncbi:TauD/TfdA family dioxygenase [uncultured Sphingomonas sp.]|uniref:TauD/TfdA family dioxygenase n=1 Tax=uncultured Sphingomonas sp. TaxID=158754 RepID=UPI0035CC7243
MATVAQDQATIGTDVQLTPYSQGRDLPLFVQPRERALRDDPDVALAWFAAHRAAIHALLLETGALAFRGFALYDTSAFGRWLDGFDCAKIGYTAGAAPRAAVAPKVFESTQAPADQVLGLHQEMAYLPRYPARIAFFCRLASVTGGETFLADMRAVTAAIDPAFLDEVERRGVMYHRNFRDDGISMGHPSLDVMHRSWQDAFDAGDRDLPLAECRAMGLEPRWLEDGSLATTYVAPGIVRHPETGERLWFNQLATQIIRAESWGEAPTALFRRHYGAGRPLPYAVTFGDGAPIPEAPLATVYAAYAAHRVGFAWSHGDVLMLDNHLVAHGRNSFTGLRDVQVGLLD